MVKGLVRRGRLVGALAIAAVLAMSGCGGMTLVLKHQGQYERMSLSAFADSLGLKPATKPDQGLGATSVKIFDSDEAPNTQLGNYFNEWCTVHNGVPGAQELYKLLLRALEEHQTQDRGRGYQWSGRMNVCRGEEGALGAYVVHTYQSGGSFVAFYEPAQLMAFIDKYVAAANDRQAKIEQQTAHDAAERERAQKEEEAIVRASGVGGTSIEETLAIIDRTSLGDSRGVGSRVDHEAPCLLVTRGKKLQLQKVRVNVRAEEASVVTDAITQDMGTLVTYVIDVSDGPNLVSLEFSNSQNANSVAQGIDHLARLCGAR